MRPTVAEIILPNLRHNLNVVGQSLPPSAGHEVIAVVKADAYGHGAVEVARALVGWGVRWLAVACLEEAVELADAGVVNSSGAGPRVIILGPLRSDEVAEVRARGFVATVSAPDDLALLEREGPEVPTILVVDTGMGRMGFLPEQMKDACDRVETAGLRVVGLFSHLAVADAFGEDDLDYTRRQFEDFALIQAAVGRRLPDLRLVSVANSGGVFFHGDKVSGAVRPGIVLYGVRPGCDGGPEGLRPVMRWVTRIDQVRSLPAGASISYQRKTVLKRPSRIALIPAGYADGLQRRLPPGFEFMVRGRPAPLAGVITMDLTMLDVTDLPDASPGDPVLLLGHRGDAQVSAEDHARAAGTIPYEILTSVGKRVRRIYLKED